MTQDAIKLSYGAAEEAIRGCSQVTKSLEELMREIQAIANVLENGALLGRGGTIFVSTLREDAVPSIRRLSDKFYELTRDLQLVMRTMGEADEASKQNFRSKSVI